MTNDEQVELFNEIVHLVFLAKYGHEYDHTNPEDVDRRWAIMMWQCDGFPIPNEPGTSEPIGTYIREHSHDPEMHLEMVRGITEATRP